MFPFNLSKLSNTDKVEQTDLENFHEFHRGCSNNFAKNVISTEGHTYKELKILIINKDIAVDFSFDTRR